MPCSRRRRRRRAAAGRTTPGRPRPVTPSTAASVSVHSTCSARSRGRRGRCQESSATTDGMPVPGASTSPGGSPPSAASVIRRVSGMCTAASSGASAFHGLPAGSREPTRPGHPRAVQPDPDQRGPALGGGPQDPGVEQVGRQPDRVAGAVGHGRDQARPAAVSTSRATVGSSRCIAVAVARRSRTPSPPLRSADGGAAPHVVEEQLEAAYGLEGGTRRGPVDLGGVPGGRREGRDVVDRLRASSARRAAATPTSPGTTAEPPARGTSSRRDSSSSAGRGRVLRQHRDPGRAGRRLAARVDDVLEHRPGRLGQRGERPARRRRPAAGGSVNGRSPLTPCSGPPARPSATPVSARSPPVDSQASASSRSRSTAAATTAGSALTNSCSRSTLDRPVSTRASSTASSARVSWSSARRIEDLVAAREASWAES